MSQPIPNLCRLEYIMHTHTVMEILLCILWGSTSYARIMNIMHTYSSSIGPHRMHSKIVSQLRVVLQTNEL